MEARLNIAGLYKQIGEFSLASHYYDLVETYYKSHNEVYNLNYLYYEMTDLYFKMYKNERAIETIKKVIYSVDTPSSLLVNSCTLLGNIYSENGDSEGAYTYYKKALESLRGDIENETLSELYFKYALANDDKGNLAEAYEYYNKCILVLGNNLYKAMAYSNLASCYLDSENYDDARVCFQKAYDIEKSNNNYEGIYYTSSKIAIILSHLGSSQALEYLLEAKKSAEFINDAYLIIESYVALGDYYYNSLKTHREALIEYIKALKIAIMNKKENEVVIKIDSRINDMRLRMKKEDFEEIESKYAK